MAWNVLYETAENSKRNPREIAVIARLRERKGFTLVELMIVVAIIGILAVIAIPTFLEFRLKAKTAEAKSNLGAIRTAELSYFSEWDCFVANQTQTPVNGRAGNNMKVGWDYGTHFSIIGFAAEHAVYYSYTLDSTASGTFVPNSAGLTMTAVGDLDGDGAVVTFWINDLWIDVRRAGSGF
jgi:type IV pilus assembly protein PilA